ncbi:hypothetical protein BH24ACT21_BH24ACT21_08910 [soil metagenome]|jgi:glyoxylase-like metal-dependent hydrolase (beta-lactamase superfamily II)
MSSAYHATLSRPYEDLLVLQHSDPGAREAGMSTNGYAVLSEGEAVYVDTPFEILLPLVRQISDEGNVPAALLLTHRHEAGHVEEINVFEREFGVPVFLHPLDARHPQAAMIGLTFQDPMDSELFGKFGMDVRHFPGHTEGHVVVYLERHGGVLLAGDAAMSTTGQQDQDGLERLIRPPFDFNVDDEQIRWQWETFDLPLSGVGPFHGTVYPDRENDIREIMRPLTRPEPTRGLTG